MAYIFQAIACERQLAAALKKKEKGRAMEIDCGGGIFIISKERKIKKKRVILELAWIK